MKVLPRPANTAFATTRTLVTVLSFAGIDPNVPTKSHVPGILKLKTTMSVMNKDLYSSQDLAETRLADSGFTLSFVVDKLLKYNPAFSAALGNEKVDEVRMLEVA